MGLGAVSLNMVWNPAIKGSNFLQASVKGIHTYATKVTKADLLRATKFGVLNRNVKQLQGHLGHIRSQIVKISANPIKIDVKTSRSSLREARKDMTAIQHDAKQIAFFTKKSAENLKAGAIAQRARINGDRVSTGSIVGAVGVATIMTMPFRASIDYEASMARVKALSNSTNEEFKKLNQTALFLGKTTEWSSSQVADGMQFLAMAGFNAKQTISAMPGLLSLATAGATDLATTSDIASNIMGGFDIDPTQTIDGMSAMSYVSDVLAKTITSANVDMRMLGDTMKYVAPVAKTAGMSLQETSAMAGLLGNIGIQGSMAGTTLKAMVLRLASPTGQAQKALSELGISALDAQGNIRSMPLLLKEVAEATKDMGSGTRLEFIKKVFGVEPAAGINKLIEQSGSGALNKYLDVVNNYKGTASKIASIQLQTTAGQFKLLGSAMEGLSISATTGLLPTIRLITNGLTSITGGIEAFTNKFPNASKWVFGLASAFIVGSVALAGFGLVASGVATAIGFISLPVVAVIGGISLLIASGVALYKNWENIKNKARQVWTNIVTAIKSPFVSFFSWIDKKFKNIFGIVSKVRNIGNSVKNKASNMWSGVKELFGFAGKKKDTLQKPKLLNSIPINNQDYKKNFDPNSSVVETGTSMLLNSIPVNNKDYKTLKVGVPKIPLESVSNVTSQAITEHKNTMQNNNINNNKPITQNITQTINVHSIDGKIDYDDLKEKFIRVQKELQYEEIDTSLEDVS